MSTPRAPTGELTILDAATRKELKRLRMGRPPAGEGQPGLAPIGVLVTPDGRRAYVALTAVGPPSPAGRVVLIALEKMEVGSSVETGVGPDGLGWAGK